MSPADLRALARVLGALLPWRQHGRTRTTPSPYARLGVHGAPLLWLRRRNTATNGSATDAARQQPPLKPPSGRLEGGVLAVLLPLPQPVFWPGGGHKPAARRALSRLARVPFARHP